MAGKIAIVVLVMSALFTSGKKDSSAHQEIHQFQVFYSCSPLFKKDKWNTWIWIVEIKFRHDDDVDVIFLLRFLILRILERIELALLLKHDLLRTFCYLIGWRFISFDFDKFEKFL